MKKSKTYSLLAIIAFGAAVLSFLLFVNYDEIFIVYKLSDIPFGYAWYYLYFVQISVFIALGTIILISSCLPMHELIHSKKEIKLKNDNMFKCWGHGLFLFPVFISALFVLSYIFLNNQVEFSPFLITFLSFPIGIKGSLFILFVESILFSVMFSIIVTNLTMIVSRFFKSFVFTVITTIILLGGYFFISESIIYYFLDAGYNSSIVLGFSLFNLLFLHGNVYTILLNGLILVGITTLILKLVYNRK